MSKHSSRPLVGGALFLVLAFGLGCYFVFAAVQGDYGVFRRVQIKAEAADLAAERDQLTSDLKSMENLTRRLSDSYLDLDLLDEQARNILGYVRADELVIR
jgi:cell division protein FtsB